MATIDGPVTQPRSSNEDIEAGIVHSEKDQGKSGNGTENEEDLPKYHDGMPPPSYTATAVPVSAEEQPWGIRAWFNRHRVFTSSLLVILSLSILGALLFGITMAAIFVPCGSDCGSLGDERKYTPAMCPILREDLLRASLPSSAIEVPRPTGFAEGDPKRLLYTDVGGAEPVIGSSLTAVWSLLGPRIFYHDARGQIYESSYGRKRPGLYNYKRENSMWGVFKVPGAVMAVNTSLAAVSLDTGWYPRGYHNTTVLYYRPANDTRIARILTRSPGDYQSPDLSPFRTYSNYLAATAVGLRILLAYREENYTAVGDGWWGEPDQSDAARHAQNIHFPDAAPESPLSIAATASSFWAEGFVLAYVPSNTDKLKTVLHYAMIEKDEISMAFVNTSTYSGRKDLPMPLLNTTYTLYHHGTSLPSVEVMPSSNNIGSSVFTVSELRAGNLTYEAYRPQLRRGSSSDEIEIKHHAIERYEDYHAYYCVFGDQPIQSTTALSNRTPPIWDFIPWSPIVGAGAGGGSWIYMVRQPEKETQGAVLSYFQHSSNQSPPELQQDVPLFYLPGGELNDSSAVSRTSANIASLTAEVTTALETAPASHPTTTLLLPKHLWPRDTDTYGMC